MKKTVILYHDTGSLSAAKLSKSLGVEAANYLDLAAPYKQDIDVLIRWGNNDAVQLKKGAVQINSADSITLGSNKKESRRVLQKNNISVPRTFFSRQDALGNMESFPLIGRQNSRHTQGKGIVMVKNKKELENSNCAYYSEFLQKEKEFRVYVFDGKVLGVAEKIPGDKNAVAWNVHANNGTQFVDLNEWDEGMAAQAVKAAKIIGQGFSGVDIMSFKGKFYILELNSAPSLSNDYRLGIFVNAFNQIIKNN